MEGVETLWKGWKRQEVGSAGGDIANSGRHTLGADRGRG